MSGKKHKPTSEKKLEDYNPGTTQAQVLKVLRKVARARPSQ